MNQNVINVYKIVINGYTLHLTCYSCPEQYDVFDEQGKMVGYFRLRGGRFTAEYPDVGGALVYLAYTDGAGSFTEEERMKQLTLAINKLDNHIRNYK